MCLGRYNKKQHSHYMFRFTGSDNVLMEGRWFDGAACLEVYVRTVDLMNVVKSKPKCYTSEIPCNFIPCIPALIDMQFVNWTVFEVLSDCHRAAWRKKVSCTR